MVEAQQMVRPSSTHKPYRHTYQTSNQAIETPVKGDPPPPTGPHAFSEALQFAQTVQQLKHPFAGRTSLPDDPESMLSIQATKHTVLPTTGLRLEDSARSMEGMGTPMAKTMPSQPSGGLYSPASGSQPNPLSTYLAAAAAAGYDIPEAVLRATRGGSLSDSDVGNLLYVHRSPPSKPPTPPATHRRGSQPPSASLLRSPPTPFLNDPITLPVGLSALPQTAGQVMQPRWSSLPKESTTQGSSGHAFMHQGLARSGGSLPPHEAGSSVEFPPFDWGLPSPTGAATPTRAPQQRSMLLEPQDVVALCAEALLNHGMQVLGLREIPFSPPFWYTSSFSHMSAIVCV